MKQVDRAVEYQQRQLSLGSSEYSALDKEKITLFLSKKESEQLTPRRLSKLAGHFMRLLPFLKGRDLTTLSKDQVVELVNAINKNAAWSPWTKHDYLVCVKMFLDYVDDGNNDRSKLVTVTTPEIKEVSEDEVITLADMRKLLDYSHNIRLRAVVQFLYDSGARVNELLSMNMCDYSFDEDGMLWFHLIGTKTRYSNRRILLDCSDDSLKLFKEFVESHPNRERRDGALWVTFHGERMGDRNLTQLLKQLSRRAGVSKPINPHWFRASKATEYVNEYGEEAAKLYFGWSKDSKMLRVYNKSGAKMLKRLMLKKKPMPKDAALERLNLETARLIFSDEIIQRRMYELFEAAGKLDLLKPLAPNVQGANNFSTAPWSGKKEKLTAPAKCSDKKSKRTDEEVD